jgi:signal transduction histidine kinase
MKAKRPGGLPIGSSPTPTQTSFLRLRSTMSLDGVLIAAVVALAVSLALSVVVPAIRVRLIAPPMDLVLDTLTTVVSLFVAMLAWVRFRQAGEPIALFQAAAFTVLTVSNSLTVVLVTAGMDGQAGFSYAAPGQAPLYDFTFARVFAASLLVLGGVASLRKRHVERAPAIVLASALAMLLMIALIQVGADRLPSLGSYDAGSLLSPTPIGAALQLLGAALFLIAAGLSRRLSRRDRSIGDGYMAVGFVFAAFAQIQTALYPSTYSGIIASGDLLRLAFNVILLLGIQAEARAALSRLQQANDDLARLQVVELEHAALEERARLSRELHDGLAQELWLAKLKTGRLSALPDLGLEGRALAGELETAIDAGLADAQQAVAALRLSGEPAGSLYEVMSRSVDEFADRFGLRAEFECQPGLPQLPPRAQAEALRIAQEALNNVRRHADATVVRVKAAVEDGRLVLVVRDNGRGFDLGAVGRSAFGLASMRERAALIGGELHIESRPRDGTCVSLFLPFPLVAVPAVEGPR